MIRIIKAILYKLDAYIMKKKYISIFAFVDKKTKLEGKNMIHRNCRIINSKIGYGTYIGWESEILNTTIGRYSSIAPRVKTIIGSHPLSPYVSIHPSFYSTQAQAGFTYSKLDTYQEIKYIDKNNKVSIEIGNDVWIGSDVKILEGINIGDGAVIATGAIITKDIPPYEVWGGIPAKKIKDRFAEEIKSKLLEIKWWDKNEIWLRENIEIFNDINVFLRGIDEKDNKISN